MIYGQVVEPQYLTPDRHQYYQDIPRMGGRHRKSIMTHFGCVNNCSYCSTSRQRRQFGNDDYKKGWLQRRPIEDIIKEAQIFLKYPTQSIDFADDDVLFGSNINEWLPEFAQAWRTNINLPLHGYVTPSSLSKCSENTIKIFSELVSSASIGVQAARESSLKLFNRQHQKKEHIIQAANILRSAEIPMIFDLIVGLPIKDPIEDALETIKFVQSIGSGSISKVQVLMLYPGTKLTSWCEEKRIPLNEKCNYDWHTGYGSIKFDSDTEKKLLNIVKLGPFFIKYNIDEHWMRALIEIDINENARKEISGCKYIDTCMFREKELTIDQAKQLLSETLLKY